MGEPKIEVHSAVGTLSVALVGGFVDHGSALVASAAEVDIDIVHAAVELAVNAGEVFGAHVADLLPEGGEVEDTIAQGNFGVADAAIVHRHAEGLCEAKGIPEEGQRRRSILVCKVRDNCLHG